MTMQDQPHRIPLPALLALLAAVLLGACGGEDHPSDAYGTFEATEVTVSARTPGELVRFAPDEGMRLRADESVGQIDTVALALRRRQLVAQRASVRAKSGGVVAQIDVLHAQRKVAERDLERIEHMVKDEAATQKQLDDVRGQIDVLDRQIEQIRTQNASIVGEVDALDAQIAQIDYQLSESTIVNPVNGTVLDTYVEPHELAAQGRPLYDIADLDTMYLRAWISGNQLASVRVGQSVTVLCDDGHGGIAERPGTISWIASEAEFTPKLIQTREERVNLVYAMRIRVANADGTLKIGMPGEVRFQQRSGEAGR